MHYWFRSNSIIPGGLKFLFRCESVRSFLGLLLHDLLGKVTSIADNTLEVQIFFFVGLIFG